MHQCAADASSTASCDSWRRWRTRATRCAAIANYIVRRGALLHGDVAGMLCAAQPSDAPLDARPSGRAAAVRGWRSLTAASSVFRSTAGALGDRAHAARLRDRRRVMRSRGPAARRRWCRRGIARPRRGCSFMRITTTMHLTRALRIFPDDPDILFLAACQRETFAGAAIQTAVALGRAAGWHHGWTSAPIADGAAPRPSAVFRRMLERETGSTSRRGCATAACCGGLGRACRGCRRAAACGGRVDRTRNCSYHARINSSAPKRRRLANREAAQAAYERAAACCFRTRSHRSLALEPARAAVRRSHRRAAGGRIGCSPCRTIPPTSATTPGGRIMPRAGA